MFKENSLPVSVPLSALTLQILPDGYGKPGLDPIMLRFPVHCKITKQNLQRLLPLLLRLLRNGRRDSSVPEHLYLLLRHQIIGDHPARDLEEMVDIISRSDFIIVDEIQEYLQQKPHIGLYKHELILQLCMDGLLHRAASGMLHRLSDYISQELRLHAQLHGTILDARSG